MKKLKFVLIAMLATMGLGQFASYAQVISPEDDGIIPEDPKFYKHNQVFAYPYLREADMMWSTRHWERIDLREKMNHNLYYPEVDLPDRKSLFSVLLDGIINEGTIMEVYADDRFEMPLSIEEIQAYIQSIDTFLNPDDPSIIDLIDTITINPKDVIAYNIKSDWFFDKQRGELKNRIIGISPVVRNPKTKDIYPLFWVWFPDARYALATSNAFNRKNNSQRLTFDQIFHFRLFASVITKEDNVYDRAIADYKKRTALDRLLESQRIREDMRNFENDLWEF